VLGVVAGITWAIEEVGFSTARLVLVLTSILYGTLIATPALWLGLG
jgi:hypothetical protein